MLVLRDKMSWSVLVCGCDFHCRREMSTFARPMARAARRGKAEDCSSSGPVTEPRYHGAYKNRSRQICARREGEVVERNSLCDRPPRRSHPYPTSSTLGQGLVQLRACTIMLHTRTGAGRAHQEKPVRMSRFRARFFFSYKNLRQHATHGTSNHE